MKSTVLAACSALLLFAAGSAAAAERITANLEAPVAAKTKIVAGGSVWTCEGGSCFAVAQTSRSTSVRACQSLAKEVGRVASFGSTDDLFVDAQLGKCNTAAAPAVGDVTQTAAN